MKRIIYILIFISAFAFNLEVKAEWIEKDKYYELDNYVTEILNYSILDNGDIWIVNKFAEVFFIDFETGTLEKKCQCEIPDTLLIKKAYFSTDGNSVSFGLYHKNNPITSNLISSAFINIGIFSNSDCQNINNIIYLNDPTSTNFDYLDIDYYSITKLLNVGTARVAVIGGGKYIDYRTFGSYYNFLIKDTIELLNNVTNVYLNKFQNISNNLNYLSGRIDNYYTDKYFSNYILYHNFSYLNKYSEDYRFYENLTFKSNDKDTTLNNIFPFTINQILDYKNKLILSNIFKQDSLFIWEYDEITKLLSRPKSFGLNNNNIHNDKNGNIFYYYKDEFKLYHYNTAQLLQTIQYPFYISKSKRININNFDFDILICSDNKIRYIEKENYLINPNLGFVSTDTLVRVDSLVKLYTMFDNENYTYTWNLGNGEIITSNSNYLEYRYKSPGLYTIQLKLTDKNGKEYNYEKLNYITVVSNLKSDFNFKFDNQFKDICYFESKAKGNPNYYQWDFGDGSKSNEINPVHKYLTYGDFKVRFIVGDSISKDTIYQNLSYYDKYIFSDISQRVSTKSLINMPKKTQAAEVFGDSLTFFQFNIYPEIRFRDFWGKDVYYEYFFLEIFFHVDKDLFNFYNNDYPTYYTDGSFMSMDLPNKESYIHLYDFILMKPNFVNFKYNDNKFNISEYGGRTYSLSPQKNNHLKMMKIDNNKYYVNFKYDSSFFIDLKTIRGGINFKKQFNFNKDISNSYSLKVNNQNFALVSFKDFSHKYFIYNDIDTIFNFIDLNIDKNIQIENIIQKYENNVLIYGKEVFDEVNSIGVIIELNLKTNETIYKTFKNCFNIKKVEKMSNTSLLVLPEVFGPKGYMLLDNELNVKLDNRVADIPLPIEFLLHIENKVYMIYQVPGANNSKTGSFEDEYATYVVMDSTLTDEVTGIISENVSNPNFLIFPNPSSDKISVDLGDVGVADLSIYDILGNEIMNIPNYTNKSEIDVSKLSIGTYTIQIKTPTGSMSQRLLVNR